MRYDEERDVVIIEDENGQEKKYAIEALFDMEDDLYALLRGKNDETLLFRVEDEGEDQYIVGITDPSIKQSILDAYQIAVEAAPAE